MARRRVTVAPTFSIGVTTYRRPHLLREALASILGQTLQDFEVIVGNDDPHGAVSHRDIGVADSRIRLVNHERNIGETANMNALLRFSTGRYFTWLADDDWYDLDFLASVQEAFSSDRNPTCVFTSYEMPREDGSVTSPRVHTGATAQMSGREFLRRYLRLELTTQGCYGVFRREDLLAMGGMRQLGGGFSPGSDLLLAVEAGLFERVAYIDRPLVKFRLHAGSLSWASPDVNAYATAQVDLWRKALTVLRHERVRDDFQSNAYHLFKSLTVAFVSAALRTPERSLRERRCYLSATVRRLAVLRGTHLLKALAFTAWVFSRLARQWIRAAVPRLFASATRQG